MGDIHKPLHSGFGDDRGGNNCQLEAFVRGSNLDAVWDTCLIKSLQLENESIVKNLLIRPSPPTSTPFSASSAAIESCQIVSRPDFYPARLVTPSYVEAFIPVMAYRLALAGHRLAMVLNELSR